jgi:hypothetical protein
VLTGIKLQDSELKYEAEVFRGSQPLGDSIKSVNGIESPQ